MKKKLWGGKGGRTRRKRPKRISFRETSFTVGGHKFMRGPQERKEAKKGGVYQRRTPGGRGETFQGT